MARTNTDLRRHARRALALSLPVFFVACHRERAPEPESKTEPASPAASAPSLPLGHPAVGGGAAPAHLEWIDPPRWTRAPSSSPMRLATYHVPKAAGDAEDGELAVFYFGPGNGGGVEANLDRWKRQFSNVKPNDVRQSERTVNGLAAHLLEIERGTFASGMPGEPTKENKGYGLLGAIVESPGGSYFFKLTAPEKTMNAARPEFMSLLDSVKPGAAP